MSPKAKVEFDPIASLRYFRALLSLLNVAAMAQRTVARLRTIPLRYGDQTTALCRRNSAAAKAVRMSAPKDRSPLMASLHR
jgi:hypothetical protein